MSDRQAWPIRAFRALLRLLPFDLRFDHGAEMEQVFRAQRREAIEGRGMAAGLRVWLDAARDILAVAPREHLSEVGRDLRYAVRGLRRDRGFAAVVVATFALAVGANSAIFTAVDHVLLRRAPLDGLDRLVMVWETDRQTGTSREPASVPDYLDFAARASRVDRVGALTGTEVNLSRPGGEPVRLAMLQVTHTLLPMLGLRPLAGRTFTPAEDAAGGPKVAIIGESLWERAFGRDPAIVGKTLRLDEAPVTIVGVLPDEADFGVPQVLASGAYSRSFVDRAARVRVDIWAPLQADVERLPRDTHPIFVVARLAAGTGLRAAQQELGAIAADLERTYRSNAGRGVFVEPLGDVVFGRVRPALLMVMGAVGLVLLIACVNIANLLLARGVTRVREVAVRTALGAAGWRLARQFLIENLVLALAAAAAGLGVAFGLLHFLLAIAPPDVPRLGTVSIDSTALLVTLAVALAAGFVFGLVPALQARRVDVQSGLGGSGRHTSGPRSSRLRSVLVVSEVTLAVVLVVGAALLIRSFWRLQQVDPGFRTAGVLKAQFQLPAARYPVPMSKWPDFKEIHAFNDALARSAASLPGVESAAIAGNHPLDPGFTNSFSVVGREAEARRWPEISVRRVTGGYFETLGLPILQGRVFRDSDSTLAQPVAVINAAAARRFFEGRRAEGARIRLWGSARTVVGVVGNERFHGIDAAAPIAVYLPLSQAPSVDGAAVLLVRTAGDPTALAPAVRAVIHERDPELAVFGLEPLSGTLSRSIGQRRFTMLLLVLLAGVAVTLAAIGIHGVLSYGVSQRTREFGIRVALGARAGDVRRRVIGEAVLITSAGLAVGLVLAAALARLFQTLLFEVSPADPVTFVGVAAFLAAVAVGAAYVPARRATRVDPVVALRAE